MFSCLSASSNERQGLFSLLPKRGPIHNVGVTAFRVCLLKLYTPVEVIYVQVMEPLQGMPCNWKDNYLRCFLVYKLRDSDWLPNRGMIIRCSYLQLGKSNEWILGCNSPSAVMARPTIPPPCPQTSPAWPSVGPLQCPGRRSSVQVTIVLQIPSPSPPGQRLHQPAQMPTQTAHRPESHIKKGRRPLTGSESSNPSRPSSAGPDVRLIILIDHLSH